MPFSKPSMITNKDPNMKNLLALLANDYDPKLKEKGKDTHNYMEEIDNPYSRRAIIGNFSESDYPRGAYDSLKKLVNFDRDNGLIEGLSSALNSSLSLAMLEIMRFSNIASLYSL